jgi:hypothetical protein
MKLLTKAIREAFPKLGATDTQGDDAKVIAKFFDPTGSWTWYATEFDGDDTFFGLVHGHEEELGYFSLNELQSLIGTFGLGIERDIHYEGHCLRDARK